MGSAGEDRHADEADGPERRQSYHRAEIRNHTHISIPVAEMVVVKQDGSGSRSELFGHDRRFGNDVHK